MQSTHPPTPSSHRSHAAAHFSKILSYLPHKLAKLLPIPSRSGPKRFSLVEGAIVSFLLGGIAGAQVISRGSVAPFISSSRQTFSIFFVSPSPLFSALFEPARCGSCLKNYGVLLIPCIINEILLK